MIGKLAVLLTVALVGLLAGCAPLSEPPVSPPPVQTAPPAEQPREPQPIVPDEERRDPAGGAVEALLKDARQHYENGDYEAAIAVAERAQRLNPRNPEVYLEMARGYVGLSRFTIAEQLLHKGLGFSRAGSLVNLQLKSLLEEISPGL